MDIDYINKVAPHHDKISCSEDSSVSNARYKEDDFGGCYRCTLLRAAAPPEVQLNQEVVKVGGANFARRLQAMKKPSKPLDEREAFEAWHEKQYGWPTNALRKGDSCTSAAIHDRWRGWQARAQQEGK